MIRVRVSGALVRNGNLLLIEHTKNSEIYYLLPGGGAEGLEDLKTSLKREFLEELGMNVIVGEVLQLAQNIAPDGSRNIFHVIFSVSSSDDPKINELDGRITGFRWLDTSEQSTIQELVFYPPVLEHLLELLNNSSYNGIEMLMPGWQD